MQDVDDEWIGDYSRTDIFRGGVCLASTLCMERMGGGFFFHCRICNARISLKNSFYPCGSPRCEGCEQLCVSGQA